MKRILLILSALALSGCESMTPAERSAVLDTGLRIAQSRLLPNHGK